MKDIKDYLLDSDHCPVCDSDHVEWNVGETHVHNAINRYNECLDCFSQWVEVYTITHYELVK